MAPYAASALTTLIGRALDLNCAARSISLELIFWVGANLASDDVSLVNAATVSLIDVVILFGSGPPSFNPSFNSIFSE